MGSPPAATCGASQLTVADTLHLDPLRDSACPMGVTCDRAHADTAVALAASEQVPSRAPSHQQVMESMPAQQDPPVAWVKGDLRGISVIPRSCN